MANEFHPCSYCGADADTGGSVRNAIVYGVDGEEKRYYCDRYCADGGEGVADKATSLVLDARKIKVELAALGIDWRKV